MLLHDEPNPEMTSFVFRGTLMTHLLLWGNAYAQVIRNGHGDVLHIPGLGFDGLVGYSPITMAKNAIGLAIATEEYGASFFANGAAPGGMLEHPGTIKDPARVRESWQSAFGGSRNSNKIVVMQLPKMIQS